MERTMTTSEVAKIHERTVQAVYFWIAEGVPHDVVRRGRRIEFRFNLDEVNEWLENRSVSRR